MQQDATGSEEGINNLNKRGKRHKFITARMALKASVRVQVTRSLVIWCNIYCMTYRNPTPTVDIIIELVDRPHRPIILIERHNPPLRLGIRVAY